MKKIGLKSFTLTVKRCYLRRPFDLSLCIYTLFLQTTLYFDQIQKYVSAPAALFPVTRFNPLFIPCTQTKIMIIHFNLVNYSFLYLNTFVFEPVDSYHLPSRGFTSRSNAILVKSLYENGGLFPISTQIVYTI